jgi:2-keto-3-deoxy-L-fuconate dehydrogenase
MAPASFADLKAIVTGGASGIGLATARYLNELGGAVVALDLVPAPAEHGIRTVIGDVSDSQSVERAVAGAVELLGGLDVLVNNAGIGAQGTIEENGDEEWRRVLEVNLLGMVRVTRAALPHLRRSGHAAIVNTCSIAATVGLPRRALYSASKGAVLSLTLAMAADHLHEGIRVNCVNPGTADTPWVSRLLSAAPDPVAERAALEQRQPHGRLVSAEEVAAAIAYLASPDAGSTTGAALAVDGGLSGLRLRPSPPPSPAPHKAADQQPTSRPTEQAVTGTADAPERPSGSGPQVALHTRLKPGMAGPYQDAHHDVPAELRDAFVRAGVRGWTIWRSGDELFHVIECEDYARLNSELEGLPVNDAWQARMAEYLDVVHGDPRKGPAKVLPVVWQLWGEWP